MSYARDRLYKIDQVSMFTYINCSSLYITD